MRSAANFKGHPLHPMLIPFPIAFFTGSWIADSICYARYDATWAIVGTRLAWGGVIMAVVAACAGAVDYFVSVPPKSTAKKRATRHAVLNLTVVAIFVLAEFTRSANSVMPSSGTIVIQTLGFVLLVIAGWMGGTLAYRNQIGVDHRYAGAGKQHSTPVDANELADPKVAVNQMRLVVVGSDRVVLARTESGYVAFEDRCTHRGGSLADGAMVRGCVQCPWHGSQFDCTTGSVVAGPAKTPIAIYRVEEESGKIKILKGGTA
jgi:uncharacterized membrane protein/nitrite reductase/ring-hydroxylating ferredoxin subunit